MIRLYVNINNNFWMRLRTESTIIMSSLLRGNPNSSSSQKKNTADKSEGDIDPEQFARILELLTNPKLENILKLQNPCKLLWIYVFIRFVCSVFLLTAARVRISSA